MSDRPLRLRTRPPAPRGQLVPSALNTGRLGGTVHGDTADLTIAGRPVVWPHGWSARSDPLRLVDPGGHVVALVGERVVTGGGFFDTRVDGELVEVWHAFLAHRYVRPPQAQTRSH